MPYNFSQITLSSKEPEFRIQIRFAAQHPLRLTALARVSTAIGLDVDTLYGQLLRRMSTDAVRKGRFGVVIPKEARSAALRVPAHIRKQLHITVYVVTSQGKVEVVEAE